MKAKKKKSGFTLIELLVTIVVLGIITAMAIPLVSKIKANQENQKYQTYLQSMEYSGKLYVDSYKEDMFGNQEKGCSKITYEELAEKKLIKDIGIEGVSCASGDSVVYVRKTRNEYSYYMEASCNGKIYSSGDTSIKANCDNEHEAATFNLITIPNEYTGIDAKERGIEITISSSRGINPYMDLEYCFQNKADGAIGNGSKAICKPLTLNVPSETEQQAKIGSESNATISASANIVTPPEVTGIYDFYLKANRLISLEGETLLSGFKKADNAGAGYKLDNTAPSLSATLKSRTSGYNDYQPTLELVTQDQYYTPQNQLRVCIVKNANEKCETEADYRSMTEFTSSLYNSFNFGNVYDGSTHTIHVWVMDAAGNIADRDVSYTKAIKYYLKYDLNRNSRGTTYATTTNFTNSNGNNDSVIVNVDNNKRTWKPVDVSDGKEATNKGLQTASRSYYDFDGWYDTASTSGGNLISDNSKVLSANYTTNSNGERTVTAYARWTPTNYSITYNMNGGTNSSSNPRSYNYESNSITLNEPTRSDYNFVGWSGYNSDTCQKKSTYSGHTDKCMTVVIKNKSHGDRTYTANWEPSIYEISMNGSLQYADTLKNCFSKIGSNTATIRLISDTYTDTSSATYRGGKNVTLKIESGKTLTLSEQIDVTSGTLTVNGGGKIVGSHVGLPIGNDFIFRSSGTGNLSIDGVTMAVEGGVNSNLVCAGGSGSISIKNAYLYQKNSAGGVVRIGESRNTFKGTATIDNTYLFRQGPTNVIVVDNTQKATINVNRSYLSESYGSAGLLSNSKGDAVISITNTSNTTMNLSNSYIMHGPDYPNVVVDLYGTNSGTVTVKATGGNYFYNSGKSSSTDPPNIFAVRNNSGKVVISGTNHFYTTGDLVHSDFASRVTSVPLKNSNQQTFKFKYLKDYKTMDSKNASGKYYMSS